MEPFTIRSRIKSFLRAPSIRRRKSRTKHQVTLEKVLGITTAGHNGLTCDPCSGTVAYPAGCVVVLLNPDKNTQRHLINSSRKRISSLSFSSDGRFLVTGESAAAPAVCVCVWDVAEGTPLVQLEHRCSVSCVAFSPDSECVVSVGSQPDASVNVWAWKKNELLATHRLSGDVLGGAFSEDGARFVTVGNRHLRFWDLQPSQPHQPLTGRPGLLGDLRDSVFCGVACGRGPQSHRTFCVTAGGVLCQISGRRVLERWVHLQTSSAVALTVTEDLIFCACANGTVRVFSPSDLRYICTLPPPHHLGGGSGTTQARTPDPRYPDLVAVTFDPVNRWLSCVYKDHSLYVWDTRDLKKVRKVHSALYHSSCVWDLQMSPTDGSLLAPGGSEPFVSCSEDGSVRVWSSTGVPSADVMSDDPLHIIHMNAAALLDDEGTAGRGKPEGRSGIRSVCISPDGKHLASGDTNGTLRVHDLTSLTEIVKAEVHESEIVSLDYSQPHTGMTLLATASRDGLIRVLDVQEGYALLQTLDEHSSSVTSVRFAAGDGKLRIVSCGADKSVFIRTAHRSGRGTAFKPTHHTIWKTIPNDMDVDPMSRYAAVGCQDHSVRVVSISTGKQKRSYKGSHTADGGLLKVQLDPSGQYLACSGSDSSVVLLHVGTGECVAAGFGHSELVTALRFSGDCQRLLSAAGDSCVFVWRLAPELTANMRERLCERRRHYSGPNRTNPFRRSSRFPLCRYPSFMSGSSESDEDEDDVVMSEDAETPQDSFAEAMGASAEGRERSEVKDWTVPCRPRKRWSSCSRSALMMTSMLDLRQLNAPPEAGLENRSCAEEHGRSSSLQDWRGARPLSAWLLPACAPEPDGVVLWPDPSAISRPGPSQEQSPVSAASMGYGSAGSSPDHRRLDDERDEAPHVNTRRDSEKPADGTSHRFQAPDSDRTVKRSVRALMEDAGLDLRCVSQRSHPYVSRTPAGRRRSAPALDPAADAPKSLTPSRVRREARPGLSQLSLERMDSRMPWDSPSRVLRPRSYMSPTTSSQAKVTRCPSLELQRPPPAPTHRRPRSRQRLSSPFTEWPSRSSSPQTDSGSSGAVTSDLSRHTAMKAFSVTSDDQEPAPSVSLEACRRAAADLCGSVRRAAGLYRKLMSHDAERSGEQQQMQELMSDALLLVRSELDSVPGSSGSVERRVTEGEGKEMLALLDQYSRLLLHSVEERLQRPHSTHSL